MRKKPIVCKNCGKKVGWVTLKFRAKIKLILYGLLIAVGTQFIAELAVNKVLGY